MADVFSSPPPGWAADLKETFRQIQEETLLFSVGGLGLAGMVFLAVSFLVADPRWSIATGFLLFGLVGLISFLRRRSFLEGRQICSMVAPDRPAHLGVGEAHQGLRVHRQAPD